MSCPSLNRKFHSDTGYSTHPIRPSSGVQPQRPVQTPHNFPPQKHNLDLASYSFAEILQMFDLTHTMSQEDLKRAKRKVLMVHPDKSRLPPEYFLFYKRAFELVVNYYQTNSRQNQIVNEHTSVEYVPLETDPQTKVQLSETVSKMKTEKFQQRFNELFEQNMSEKPDPSRNEWFHNESSSPVFTPTGPVNASNLNSAFETVKTRQREQGMVRYSGVRELSSFVGGPGSSFYETGAQEEDNVEDIYVSSDPFSKLKYEDLRKVHKDQTVFAIGETDYANVKKYANVEQYSRERGATQLTPMETQQAQRIFDERERIAREQQAKKQHMMELRMQEYAEKNKRIMGAFLHLEN
jgi:hypothetical protein